ncbi:hypothetical protein L1987_87755 [Smallanthus sonchifolius]|nr:hypothetical protein L1987_87755 [Smallanthus sonchifolius]
MGCPQADARSAQVPRHAVTAHAANHDQHNGISTGISTAWALAAVPIRTAPRGATGSGHDGALTLSGAPFQGTWARSVVEDASPDYNSNDNAARFSSWADPGSLAVTKGILLSLAHAVPGVVVVLTYVHDAPKRPMNACQRGFTRIKTEALIPAKPCL